mmetsp:Transcript_5507/g.17717  ORF Transcript_5507/g.17717 Transcript_5507/m.17717 type:complete len:253 (-) Transcript_5507:9-767(-)
MSHETQIVLDLPDEVAELLEADPPPHMEIRWDPLPDGAPVPPPCGETARFCVAGHEFFAKLVSLPTVVESKKSVDPAGEVYYESRKIGQVLVVAKSREELPAGTEHRDGLTPPMAAIRERKWRRRPLHDPKAVEQVALELERGLRGGGPLKPEYDMVDEEVEVSDYGDDEEDEAEEAERRAAQRQAEIDAERGSGSGGGGGGGIGGGIGGGGGGSGSVGRGGPIPFPALESKSQAGNAVVAGSSGGGGGICT